MTRSEITQIVQSCGFTVVKFERVGSRSYFHVSNSRYSLTFSNCRGQLRLEHPAQAVIIPEDLIRLLYNHAD